MKLWCTCILFIISAALTACSHTSPQRPPKDTPVSFVRDVAPILEERCVVCHHQANAPNCGSLNLETRQLAFGTGRNTPVIIPGDPDQSPLVAALLAREIHASSGASPLRSSARIDPTLDTGRGRLASQL